MVPRLRENIQPIMPQSIAPIGALPIDPPEMEMLIGLPNIEEEDIEEEIENAQHHLDFQGVQLNLLQAFNAVADDHFEDEGYESGNEDFEQDDQDQDPNDGNNDLPFVLMNENGEVQLVEEDDLFEMMAQAEEEGNLEQLLEQVM